MVSSLTLLAFTLLLLQLIISAVVVFVWNVYNIPDIAALKPDFDAFSFKQHLQQNFKLILLSLSLAVFFPLWIQATLHFENITALLMILVGISSPHDPL